jgi:hypothetical protein
MKSPGGGQDTNQISNMFIKGKYFHKKNSLPETMGQAL